MRPLERFSSTQPLPPLQHILCLGAHCDDIDIGCGGALLTLLERQAIPRITWVVFASNPEREAELRASATRFLAKASSFGVICHGFRDGFLPYHGAEVKQAFEELKKIPAPDLIFTHARHDLHQDHRLVNELTWNTFRDHTVLEFEIPKFDGDLGAPNAFIPVSVAHADLKNAYLMESYPSQRGKNWFDPETFRGLMRLRGMECLSPTRYAEAFYARKLRLL